MIVVTVLIFLLEKSAFIWLGKDGHYIDVHCNYFDLYTHGDGQGWLEFKVTVELKRLGTDDETNETIVFEYKKPVDEDGGADGNHSIQDCIWEDLENDGENSDAQQSEPEFFKEADVQRVIDWLNLVDLDPGEEKLSNYFMQILLHLAVNQRMYIHREDDDGSEDGENDDDEEKSAKVFQKYNDEMREFNGDMAREISKLMQHFLNGETDWATRTQFGVKLMLFKLTLIDCINNVRGK